MNQVTDGSAPPLTRINPPGLFDGTEFGMSQGTRVEELGLVVLSGQVSWDETGRVRGTTYGEQTELAMRNVITALEAAGSSVDDIVHLRLLVRGEVSEHLDEVTGQAAPYLAAARPALTGIGVASLATPDTLVEIEVMARVRRG